MQTYKQSQVDIRGDASRNKCNFKMAATIDYFSAFAATSNAIGYHHFDVLFSAYLCENDMLTFLRENNPKALREVAKRFGEAIRRGF